MADIDKRPTPEAVTTEKTAAPSSSPAVREPRSFLATFLLTMIAGPLGLRHFYLGDKKLGWLRTGLFLGGYAWFFVVALASQNALAILGFLAIATASVWAVVDFFYVYNAVKVDAEGQPLQSTHRDRKWAKLFYWTAIIAFAASLIFTIVGATFIQNEIKKGNWGPQTMREQQNDQDFNMDEYLRQLEEQTQDSTQLN